MAILDFLRKKVEPEAFAVSSGKKKKKNMFLLSLSEAFEQKKGKKTTKVQKLEKRINPRKLELAARMDELTSRCVNFYATQIVGPGFDIVCKDENSKTVYEEFVERTHLILKLEDVVRDMCITGNGWLEKMFNEDDKPILVDVAYIDARFMDFLRTSLGLVDEDDYGQIKGYSFKGWIVEEKILPPEKIVHFPLFSRGNELAMGFVEPLYRTIYDKLNSRDGFSQQQWRTGYPLYTGKVGMPPNPKTGFAGVPPKQEIVDKIADEMEDLKAKHKMVFPYYVELGKLDPSKGESPHLLLEFFNQSISAGFGIPYDLAMGAGKANKASLEVAMVRDLDRVIRSRQEKISIILINEIFSVLKEQHNLEELPKIVWREITPPDLNRMAKRYVEFIQTGIMRPEDVREKIYNLEGIPYNPEDFVEPEPTPEEPGMPQIKTPPEEKQDKKALMEEKMRFENELKEELKKTYSLHLANLENKLSETIIPIKEKMVALSTDFYDNVEKSNKLVKEVLLEVNSKLGESSSRQNTIIEKMKTNSKQVATFNNRMTLIEQDINRLAKIKKQHLPEPEKIPEKKPVKKTKAKKLGEKKKYTVEEIILTLKTMKESFPDSAIVQVVDSLISNIMIKETGKDIPQESGGVVFAKLAEYVIDRGHVTTEEAILLLKYLKGTFLDKESQKLINWLVEQIILKSSGVQIALQEMSISVDEALAILRKIKDAFPEESIERIIELLIKKIMLKTTGIEEPQEE